MRLMTSRPSTAGARAGEALHVWDSTETKAAGDQRWTLRRIKALIGRLFHVRYTVEGTWKLMRRHGWSCQVPVRHGMERDEQAIAVCKAEVWPRLKHRARPGRLHLIRRRSGPERSPPRSSRMLFTRARSSELWVSRSSMVLACDSAGIPADGPEFDRYRWRGAVPPMLPEPSPNHPTHC
jgi:Winged helix-turn helix